jgi:hypothetical protein
VATSTLRAAIIVAALVFGGIVLANAFPGADTSGPSTNRTTSSPTSDVSPTTAPPTTPPRLEGALLQVLNGSGMDGLAGTVATCLREQGGADIPAETHVGNAPERFEVTTLVFRPDRQALAELLRTRFFPGARLQKGTAEPTPPNEVTVILGADYAPVAECQG